MTPADCFGLMVLAGYLALVVAVAFSGDCVQSCRIECPVLDHVVRCRVAHDVRTGRWLRVEGCSAFAAGSISCGRDCVLLTNQGLLRTCANPRG